MSSKANERSTDSKSARASSSTATSSCCKLTATAPRARSSALSSALAAKKRLARRSATGLATLCESVDSHKHAYHFLSGSRDSFYSWNGCAHVSCTHLDNNNDTTRCRRTDGATDGIDKHSVLVARPQGGLFVVELGHTFRGNEGCTLQHRRRVSARGLRLDISIFMTECMN